MSVSGIAAQELSCDSISGESDTNRTHISLIQDSTSELQWCTELDYQFKSSNYSKSQSAPKSIFESSLLGSFNSNYETPPSSNYTDMSKNIDANLAEIDIETFRSEDFNAVFKQRADEEHSRSIYDDRSLSLSYIEGTMEGIEEVHSLLESEDYSNEDKAECDANDAKLGVEKNNVSNTDISVDSLDMSLLENNTSELLMRCTEQDKNKYTIAFEGSITSSHDLIDSNAHKKLSFANKSRNVHHMYAHNSDNSIVKSDNLNVTLHSSIATKDENIDINDTSKLSHSIPNIRSLIRVTGELQTRHCPVSGFMPLYDLQSSQSSNSHSSGSEFSPPRSLVKMFMQNRISPQSSGQISPSLSFESRSQESVTSPNYIPKFSLYSRFDSINETNNNIDFKTTFDYDNTYYEDNTIKNKLKIEAQKIAYNLKNTFPIKEVDETLSDSSNTDINMKSIEGYDTHRSDVNKNSLASQQYSQMTKRAINESQQTKPNQNTIRSASAKSTNPNNSYSSGYNSSRFGFDSTNGINLVNNRTARPKSALNANTRTTGTQFPVHFRDKEVQASLCDNSDTHQYMNTKHMMSSDSPQQVSRSLHVYYPNYSLPDLSFLHQILEMGHTCNGSQTIHLSPTKHILPNRESTSVKMRSKVSKAKGRPKSYTDFERLSKQNFGHIKDWDSLNVLLPNELKAFLQKQNFTNNEEHNSGDKTFKDDSRTGFVRMRSRRGSQSSAKLDETHDNYRTNNRRFKRYSLQEPYTTLTHQTTYSCSDNRSNCMTRSITMPNCHGCHCHQHCNHNCHNCCHSCHTPCASPSSPNKPFNQTNFDINSSSIDKLCQILAMDLSFKKIMNIINNQINASNLPQTVEQMNEKQSENDESNETYSSDSSNFKELRKHWETLATSPGSSTNTLTQSNAKRGVSNATHQPIIKGKTETRDNVKKPIIAKKPQLEIRKPLSYNTRPTTLNADNTGSNQRKSMIPIPKTGQIKSPTLSAAKAKTLIPTLTK